jgi:hypothetical protein
MIVAGAEAELEAVEVEAAPAADSVQVQAQEWELEPEREPAVVLESERKARASRYCPARSYRGQRWLLLEYSEQTREGCRCWRQH